MLIDTAFFNFQFIYKLLYFVVFCEQNGTRVELDFVKIETRFNGRFKQ